MSDHDEILVDKQRAQEYATEYLSVVLQNMNAAGLMISSVMAKFTRFVELPEVKTVSFWERAVRAIDAPVFAFSKMLSEQERAIDKASLEISAAVGDWRAKLKDQAPPPEGITELNQLDSSKPIIQELIDASQRALVVWAKTLHLIDLETGQRVSILAKVQKLLSMPAFPNAPELDQIESACLWKMIRDWVSANVFWLETIIMVPKIGTTDTFIRAGTETTLEGINNNQVAKIAALFGPGVPRGKYFNAPAIAYGWNALDYWGVSTRYRKVYRSQAAASGSM